jgi:hypothetical protein
VLGRKEAGGPQCQELIQRTRRNTGGESSNWRARGGRLPNWRASSKPRTSIRKWVKQAALEEGLRSDGLTTAEREELNRLRREGSRKCDYIERD